MNRTLEEKIEYLEKLLKVYLVFSRRYNKVSITLSGKHLIIMWYSPKQENWYSHEMLEFPVTDIDTRLDHYKQKIKTSFKNRHLKKN